MTLGEAIAKADAMRPNAIDELDKVRWVLELESEFAETYGVRFPEEDDLHDPDYELLVRFPRDNVYPLYLCAMIDNAQEDTALYQNDMTIANQAVADVKAWYRREHRVKHPVYIRGL